jgi:hypothetical protein
MKCRYKGTDSEFDAEFVYDSLSNGALLPVIWNDVIKEVCDDSCFMEHGGLEIVSVKESEQDDLELFEKKLAFLEEVFENESTGFSIKVLR